MANVDEILAPLNPEQREAVVAPPGPLQVFAGPGSGKTRVLTHRIAYLIATEQAQPENVCAITFTNKAADEMKKRLEVMLGPEVVGQMQVSTSHSLGLRIIKDHPNELGRQTNLSIYADDEQRSLLRSLMEESNVNPDRLGDAQDFISNAKNNLLTPKEVDWKDPELTLLYQAYEAALLQANAVDFDDLLKLPVELFQAHPEILAIYQERYRFLFNDEFQDTNRAQFEFLRLMASKYQQITIVADDDQCVQAGTLVSMADGSEKLVEDIKRGNKVLSSYGGVIKSSQVANVYSRFTRYLVRIHTAGGHQITSTPLHTHFAGYVLGLSPKKHLVYLMQKEGYGFRIGVSSTASGGPIKPVLGYRRRCMQEHADAVWIIATYDNENDARIDEYLSSLRYGIHTLPFSRRPNKSGSSIGLSCSQDYIDTVFAALDTKEAAARLLGDRHLLLEYPHFQPRSRNSNRRNVNVTLCGDRGMHKIAIEGNDKEGQEVLRSMGLSVCPTKKDGWIVKSSFASFADAMQIVDSIRKVFSINLILTGHLGDGNVGGPTNLPFTPAAHVMPGMIMFDASGGYDIVEKVELLDAPQKVYDLDIERTHNFIANGILTHNSIYGFRGADYTNALSFKRDYPDAQTVVLTRNYRSTQHVLNVARGLIVHNNQRKDKELWSPRTEEQHAVFCSTATDTEEAQYVAQEISRLHRDEELPHSGFAILYRTNAQSRSFETALNQLRIPYQIANGTAFYDRKEIRDVVAYLKFLVNPADLVSFRRIINAPPRGIGKKSVDTIVGQAKKQGKSPLEMLREVKLADIKMRKAYDASKDFVRMFESLQADVAQLSISQLVETVLDRTKYLDTFKALPMEEREMRVGNVYELVGYTKTQEGQGLEGLVDFLQETALMADDDQIDKDAPKVTLSTLHKSKGLEFPVVFVTGVEEGLIPHERAYSQHEERCLLYVGITRAKDKLYLTQAQVRSKFGQRMLTTPSRFLDEIPSDLLQSIELDTYSMSV